MSWRELLAEHINRDELDKTLAKQNELKQKPAHLHFSETLNNLPPIDFDQTVFDNAEVAVKSEAPIDETKWNGLVTSLKKLMPWKKGPYQFNDLIIDAEWRSDFKWERLKDKIDSLEGHRVLDIGCNNGYFMFRMQEQKPEMVLGIDPVLPCWAQFEAVNHYAKQDNLYFEMLGVDDIVHFKKAFDTIFSMGIIYHHRNPIAQLLDMREALKPGGQLIIETIGIEGDDDICLFPQDRYAKMRNVWFLPTLSALKNWLVRAKFVDIEVISTEYEHMNEQRQTEWSSGVSLVDFLSADKKTTVEGYPIPQRFCIKCYKNKDAL